MHLPNNWVKRGHTPEIPDYCLAKGNGQDCYVDVTVGLVGNHGTQIQLDFKAFIPHGLAPLTPQVCTTQFLFKNTVNQNHKVFYALRELNYNKLTLFP